MPALQSQSVSLSTCFHARLTVMSSLDGARRPHVALLRLPSPLNDFLALLSFPPGDFLTKILMPVWASFAMLHMVLLAPWLRMPLWLVDVSMWP